MNRRAGGTGWGQFFLPHATEEERQMVYDVAWDDTVCWREHYLPVELVIVRCQLPL